MNEMTIPVLLVVESDLLGAFAGFFAVGIGAGVALRLIPWAWGRIFDSALLITSVDVKGE